MRIALSTYINVKEDMKFQPTEQQLVNFLKMKMDGRDSQFIPEIDLYKYEPWDLPALSVAKCSEEWFFFTQNSNKYITGNRSNRQTKNGYWKKTCRELPVKTHKKSKVIGKKRIFVFHKGRASHERKTNWVMHEYFVPEAKTNLVLCRIKWNSEGSSEDSNNSIACFDTEEIEMTATFTLPEGFKFQPSEERLLNHYLRNKLALPEIDLCRYEPHQLPALSLIESDKEWFFFNRQRRRTTEQGYWKITGNGRKIKASDKSIIGKMRIMTFYKGRAPDGRKTGWVIHEYSLLPNDNNQGDIVVCRLNLKSDDDNYVDDSATTCDEGEPSTKTASNFDVEDVPAESFDLSRQIILFKTDLTVEIKILHHKKLFDPPEVNLDSLFPPLQPQDYPPILQSPLSTELRNVPHANVYYSECMKWQCAFGNDDSYFGHIIKRNSSQDHDKPVRHAVSNFENGAPDYRILEPRMYSELGDALHNIECNELQSPLGDNDSSLTEYLNTSIADQGYYSSEETAETPLKDSNPPKSYDENS